MTDMNAFRLGENIATTPGKVVFQNEMTQLHVAQVERVHGRHAPGSYVRVRSDA
jgi:poly(3-hydroxyalkanoate) synthetase